MAFFDLQITDITNYELHYKQTLTQMVNLWWRHCLLQVNPHIPCITKQSSYNLPTCRKSVNKATVLSVGQRVTATFFKVSNLLENMESVQHCAHIHEYCLHRSMSLTQSFMSRHLQLLQLSGGH